MGSRDASAASARARLSWRAGGARAQKDMAQAQGQNPGEGSTQQAQRETTHAQQVAAAQPAA